MTDRNKKPGRKASAEPKRRNATQTKARILAAAQQAFSDPGYAQAGIRDIAARADVSSPLLQRYFGSKAGLFEAALIDAMPLDDIFAGDRDTFGERLAERFMDPDLEIWPPAMIALSTGDAEAREIATRVTDGHAVASLAKWLGPPDARLRAVEITILSVGFVLFTRQIPLTTGSKAADKKLTQWLADSIQAIVDRG